ncbi:hypothetical protein OROMI_013332 [Orobanche minor]
MLMASIRLEPSKQYYATSSLVIGYALCSSLLAIINKFAITSFNYPGLLTALQYLTSALGVWILGNSDLFEPARIFVLCVWVAYQLLRFAASKAISATAFTVTGVVNKFLAVAINVLIWDKHSTPFGLVCLLLTVVGGVLYE